MNLVSIITPVYNSEKYIGKTIQSVIDQTYTDWEMIIVDDKSTDNSVEEILKYVNQDSRIKLFQMEENKGSPCYARNFGTDLAKGDILAFLDSDDLWLPNKLELQLAYMVKNNYPIVFASYQKFKKDIHHLSKPIVAPQCVDYRQILKNNPIGCLTAIYNKKITGPLYQINHKHEDYIMWMEVLKNGFNAYGLKDVLAYYRVHENSISNSKLKMANVTWNIYRKVLKQNKLIAAKNFIYYAFHASIKYLK